MCVWEGSCNGFGLCGLCVCLFVCPSFAGAVVECVGYVGVGVYGYSRYILYE